MLSSFAFLGRQVQERIEQNMQDMTSRVPPLV